MSASGLMRAVQAVEPGGAFVATKIPVPEPGPGQVRVKVHACGVCAGERIARFGLLGVRYPRVPGHEIAGTIDATGPGTGPWKQGDRVGIGWHGGSCFVCDFCRQGNFNACVERKIVGASYDGGYAEYMVAPRDALARIPDGLSFEEAAPLMCAGITTFNSLRNTGARPGDTVAIHGIGGLGHVGLQFADKMGFRVVAISRGRSKEALARKLGANEWIDSEAGSAGEQLARMGGAAVILSTVPSSPAQTDLIQGLKPNGRLVIAAAGREPLQHMSDALVFHRRSVAGWSSGHAKDSEETMAFAALKGIRPMVETHPLEEAENAYQNMSKARFRAVLVA